MTALAAIGFGPFDLSWLAAALVLTTPILLPAVGEVVSQRAGVLNVGLEGMMLVGAFSSYLVAFQTQSLIAGVLAGMVAGTLFGVVMSLLAIEAGADQIVSGVAINLAAFGLTSYWFDQSFGGEAELQIQTLQPVAIPVLAAIPLIGDVVFTRDTLVYLAFLLVPVCWFLLYRTRWGLAVRAAGELPAAADTAGISVRRVRWLSTLLAGSLAGVGGAYLVIGDVGFFQHGMTAGRGFLALVAVIFGRWTPLGVFGACLVLGATDALALRLANQGDVPQQVWAAIGLAAAVFVVYHAYRALVRRGQSRPAAMAVVAGIAVSAFALFAINPAVALPAQVWRSLPYILALVVLAGALTSSRMPTKLTLPYRRGQA